MARSTREIVDDLYASYARRDVAQVAAIIHDDVDRIIYGPMQVFPFAGARRGRSDVLAALGEIAEHYELERYEPRVIVVDGERAAVMSEVAFRQRATDRALRFMLANFLRFEDGRLIEFREFVNSFDLVELALGRHIKV